MEAEEQDFIVLLLTILAGKTLPKYPPSRLALSRSDSVCVWLGAPSAIPCQLYSPAVLLLHKLKPTALCRTEGSQETTSPLAPLMDELLQRPWVGIGLC